IEPEQPPTGRDRREGRTRTFTWITRITGQHSQLTFLALQVVSGGVAWLIDRQLRAARQLDRGEHPPALVAGWLGDGDTPGGQVDQRLLDVVTHQVEL